MTWEKTATFEEGSLTGTYGFTSTTGSGLAASTDAEYAGSYGMAVTGATAARYGSFTSLGTKSRIETEFWFDPNSIVTGGLVPVCEVLNYSGYPISRVLFTKPTGTSNYALGLAARNLFKSSTGSVLETDYWLSGKQYVTMSDAYTKIRMVTILSVGGAVPFVDFTSIGSPPFNPGGGSGGAVGGFSYSGVSSRASAFKKIRYDSYLYKSDALCSIVSGVYSASLGRLDSLRYGITDTVASGISGTMYFDNISWATDETSVEVPMILLRTRVADNKIWTEPWTTTIMEGTTGALSLCWEDAGEISSPTAYCYLNGSDASSTHFPTGSNSSSLNIQTTKSITGLEGSKTYYVVFQATVGGKTLLRQHRIKVAKKGEE